MTSQITIEVAYALIERQEIISASVAAGSTIGEVLEQLSIQAKVPEIDLTKAAVGVFGKVKSRDYAVENGDRIEIYRPLTADPKEIRRQRAAMD